ncbi:hypothetical protein [Nocardia sp. NPDC048505]|uniref:hypothetical protein n=1 Tax=unclassified Nocardia TaxID=2637762 RepID=UPI0033FDA4FF
MVESEGDPGPRDDWRDNTRVLSIAAALAAGAAVIVSVAVTLNSEQPGDDRPDRISAAYSAIPNSPTVAPPPAPPFPARQVGDDCSAGGVQARWTKLEGQWNCSAIKVGPNGKKVGEDCSENGVVKRWNFLPDGSWACSPPQRDLAGASTAPPVPPPPPPAPVPPPPPPPEPVAPEPVPEPQYVPEYAPPPPAPEPAYEAPAPAPEPPPPPPPPPPPLPFELPPLPFFPPPG